MKSARWILMSGILVTFMSADLTAAQVYPTKPIRFIVAFAPGGGTDIVARSLSQRLSEKLGQQVVVDNRPGGGTIIATDLLARAAPDGHTILIVDPSFAINPSLYRRLPYDPDRDFRPITLVASFPLIVVVHPTLPVRTIKELIALARAKPGQLNYGSAGSGSSTHLAPEILKMMADIDIVHVPYKGGGPAVTELVGGHVALGFLGIPPALPHVKAGKLRALAVTSAARSSAAPDLPTVAESGVAGYDVPSWQGVFAPAGTSDNAVNRLNQELSAAAHSPEVKERLAALGAEPVGNSPQEFVKYLKREREKYGAVIRRIGLQAD